MSLLRNFLENIRRQQQARKDIDDDETKDLYLRSLRRQRRTQKEEFEKERLKKEIKAHELIRTREAVLGIKTQEKIKLIKGKIKKKKSILTQEQFMIPKKRPEKSFLSRGKL